MRIELARYEVYECCELDTKTGKIEFYKDKKINKFTGAYFKDGSIFFGVYPTKTAPLMFYEGKEYRLHDGLNITLEIYSTDRRFEIVEYGIIISYKTPCADEWFDANENDLLYEIYAGYKDKKFYKKWIN